MKKALLLTLILSAPLLAGPKEKLRRFLEDVGDTRKEQNIRAEEITKALTYNEGADLLLDYEGFPHNPEARATAALAYVKYRMQNTFTPSIDLYLLLNVSRTTNESPIGRDIRTAAAHETVRIILTNPDLKRKICGDIQVRARADNVTDIRFEYEKAAMLVQAVMISLDASGANPEFSREKISEALTKIGNEWSKDSALTVLRFVSHTHNISEAAKRIMADSYVTLKLEVDSSISRTCEGNCSISQGEEKILNYALRILNPIPLGRHSLDPWKNMNPRWSIEHLSVASLEWLVERMNSWGEAFRHRFTANLSAFEKEKLLVAFMNYAALVDDDREIQRIIYAIKSLGNNMGLVIHRHYPNAVDSVSHPSQQKVITALVQIPFDLYRNPVRPLWHKIACNLRIIRY